MQETKNLPSEFYIPTGWLDLNIEQCEVRLTRAQNRNNGTWPEEYPGQIQGHILWLEDRIKYLKTTQLLQGG